VLDAQSSVPRSVVSGRSHHRGGRWYLTYPFSYRQNCGMLRDRGVSVAPSTAMRWVLRYAPEFEKRWQGYEKPMALSWRVDETYIKVGGHWTYL
jgi:transposase-like protein